MVLTTTMITVVATIKQYLYKKNCGLTSAPLSPDGPGVPEGPRGPCRKSVVY